MACQCTDSAASHYDVRLMTDVIRVAPDNPDPTAIARAAECLRSGGLVAFPTETVYGLGVNALDRAAVRRLFAAKSGRHRSADRPRQVDRVDRGACFARAGQPSKNSARRFWPGPLTLVVPRSPQVPDEVTAGLPTVAVRVPLHPVARALIDAAAVPVAAPSANLFSRPSPTQASHVLDDLERPHRSHRRWRRQPRSASSQPCSTSRAIRRRPAAGCGHDRNAAGGARPRGHRSSWLDGAGFETGRRSDAVARHAGEALLTARGADALRGRRDARPCHRSSPLRALQLARGSLWASSPPKRIAANLHRWRPIADSFCACSGRRTLRAVVASKLYATLRELDAAGADVILVHGFPDHGLGAAVQDRLRSAAAGRIVRDANALLRTGVQPSSNRARASRVRTRP